MKKNLALVFTASALLLAGCSSMDHGSKQWEYKVVVTLLGPGGGAHPAPVERREQFLNELGKDGWVRHRCRFVLPETAEEMIRIIFRSNESLHTNRRSPSPASIGRKLWCVFRVQASLPAAVCEFSCWAC